LCRVHIVNVIKSESLPHTKVRIGVHISLPLALLHLSSQIFKNGARFIIRGNLDNPSEFKVISLLPGQRRPHSYHNFEVIISGRSLRLKEGLWHVLMLRGRCHRWKSHWRHTLRRKRVASHQGRRPLGHEIGSSHLLLMLLHAVLQELRDKVGLLKLELRRETRYVLIFDCTVKNKPIHGCRGGIAWTWNQPDLRGGLSHTLIPHSLHLVSSESLAQVPVISHH
jgi:hypothetical protein